MPQPPRLAIDELEEDPARRQHAEAPAIDVLVSLASPRFTKVYPTSLGVARDSTYQPSVATK
jgi:hypothetical protein